MKNFRAENKISLREVIFNQMSIFLNWFILDGWGLYLILTWGDNSFVVISFALDPFLGTNNSKGTVGVATDHQCLPVSCGKKLFLMEG